MGQDGWCKPTGTVTFGTNPGRGGTSGHLLIPQGPLGLPLPRPPLRAPSSVAPTLTPPPCAPTRGPKRGVKESLAKCIGPDESVAKNEKKTFVKRVVVSRAEVGNDQWPRSLQGKEGKGSVGSCKRKVY